MPDRPPPPVRATLAAARVAPIPPGRRSATLMAHGSMRLRYGAPKGEDARTPRAQDEVDIVAAGAPHRFVAFSDDFAARVVFHGPEGGEGGRGSAGTVRSAERRESGRPQ